MRYAPKEQIATDAIKAWKMTAALVMLIVWIMLVVGGILTFVFDFPQWPLWIAIGIIVLSTYFVIFKLPNIRWRRWRYEVFDQEIYIQHGILIVTRTLIPMVRVQHVDTKQGPILKKYNLASITISTAATTHGIPALYDEDASNLRDRISALARVDEDDV
ncbi:PH domain-containing protein [Lentibacillus saliphilus]|uniref:PH domain-containing protein n=1 Tax=Lentibacillus saliphilus TaxID=2737028 RepID=UPI001C30333C|nr:PH domain-containing protein [Lentibacillus saliphilus]